MMEGEKEKEMENEINACTFELYSINLFDSISHFVFVMVDSADRVVCTLTVWIDKNKMRNKHIKHYSNK